MMPTSLNGLSNQLALIAKAPVVAAGTVVLITGAIWTIYAFAYKSRIEVKDSEIAFLETHIDLYKDKLSRASPEEARRRIDALEDAVSRLGAELRQLGEVDLVTEFEKRLEGRPMDGGTF